MIVTINGNDLNVEVLGPENGPVLIAHHGGGGIGSLEEPRTTFGPLANEMRVVVFDARGCGRGCRLPALHGRRERLSADRPQRAPA